MLKEARLRVAIRKKSFPVRIVKDWNEFPEKL